MKNSIRYMAALMAVLLPGISGKLLAQKSTTASAVQSMIEKKEFIFVVTSVSPLRGRTKFVNETYDVKIHADSLVSDLPYFGEAQRAPLSKDEGAIRFTSTKFEYRYEPGKKNSWSINIEFKDQTATRQFHFLIFDDGNASLDVNSTFRDPISFNGYLKKK